MAQHYGWLIPLIPALPALAAVIGLVCGGLFLHRRTPVLTIGAMAVSTLIAWFAVFLPVVGSWWSGGGEHAFSWSHSWRFFQAGGQWVSIGVVVDHLTAAMLAMVTLLVLLIEIYAVGYMASDELFSRFHAEVSLFAAGMLGLVVANNYLTLLVSWEIMGLCSYLLIGFWYFKDSARKAAKKAFIVTRLGDLGMLVGIIIAFWGSGSFEFDTIFTWAKSAPAVLVVLTALGLFCGSVGKSAQFPLHVWLPDAMEGPTPVSALIHAATMVSAGVYLVARSYPLFYGMDGHLEAEILGFVVAPLKVVAWIGGFTALFAATIAVVQSDIKKVLAYSTVSQLGYMFLGLGVGGYTAACFHLLTHAFFKALLFLGSGSVIHAVEHAMHHEHVHEDPQNMANMGGLAKKMPRTYWTFLIGTLALAGIFPFSGFFSKDEIVLEVLFGAHRNPTLGAMALVAAFLTAFYMSRLMFLTFYGTPRLPQVWEHTEDSPKTMTTPLLVIAVFAALAGLPALPALLSAMGIGAGHNLFHGFINLGALAGYGVTEAPPLPVNLGLAGLATLLAVSGIGLGWVLYGTRVGAAVRDTAHRTAAIERVLDVPRRLYYMNELLYGLLVTPMFWAVRLCNEIDRRVIDMTVNLVGWLSVALSTVGRWFDQNVVDLLVNVVGAGSKGTAEIGKFLQTGRVQNYAMIGVAGLVIVMMVVLKLLGGA
ncbi:MAG: NADH-quinone oxidoreductase subunit L [Armatimonadetes bacterium]|nr:NADH-quinone oxidoreductase subunit L [Armatimonadota bacterium]